MRFDSRLLYHVFMQDVVLLSRNIDEFQRHINAFYGHDYDQDSWVCS